jgi:NOL1/NOP2/fmu family ribosome biogenesis protein
MFRKDPLAVRSWGDFSIDKCTGMQRSILKQVPVMLKPGGRLVYSTCTFSPEENEGMIDTFIKDNPEFEVMHIETIEDIEGLAPGRPDWADAGDSLDRSIRLWPHRIKGEGHFVTLLKKREDCEDAVTEYRSPPPPVANLEGYNDFVQDSLEIKPEEVFQGSLIQHYSKLYLAPEGAPDLRGLKVVRPGWFLGELQKDRFKPGAPLALGLKKEHAKRVLDFPSDSQEVIRYLKGETLEMTGEYGWNLVCVDGFPLGWAKILRDRFNNYYPSGWRWLD